MNSGNDIYVKLLRKFEIDSLHINSRDDSQYQKYQVNTDAAKQLSILTRSFLRPLIFLRSFGNHPLHFSKINYKNSGVVFRRFRHSGWNWVTAYSLLGQCVYIGGFLMIAFRLLRGEYKPGTVPGTPEHSSHNDTYGNGLVSAFLTTYFLACGAGAVTSFMTTSQLAAFMNGWEHFVFQFPVTFPGQFANFQFIQRISIFLFAYTVGLFLILFITAFYIYRICLLDSSGSCTWIEREQSLFFLGFGSASVINSTFEQYKVAIMMHTVARAFYEIKSALSECKHNYANGKLNLKNLFSLIYHVRRQLGILRKTAGVAQLFILFFLFSVTIVVWMMIIQIAGGHISSSVVQIVFLISLVQYSRFVAISKFSEDVVEQEKGILNEISQIKSRSTKGQVEIQIFMSSVLGKPSEFILSNIITFRRSLLLAIMSNSTTYLIAIQQLLDISI